LTNPTDMVRFMYSEKQWKLKPPKLIISVTGGAQNFTIPHQMKKAFKEGLIKAAITTDAWIITGGTNAGVMRLVGEAVAEEYPKYSTDSELVVLGVLTWGIIDMREKLYKVLNIL
jgi:transient receptor potential cation channel subfamily M protein 2